jgi:hypothetical protein
MPRPSRICSVIDCGRAHHAQGLCRRCYGAKVRKDALRKRSESRPSHIAQNPSVAGAATPASETRGETRAVTRSLLVTPRVSPLHGAK